MAPMSSFAVHIADADLEPDPLDPDTILEGSPETTGIVLFESEDGAISLDLRQVVFVRVAAAPHTIGFSDT